MWVSNVTFSPMVRHLLRTEHLPTGLLCDVSCVDSFLFCKNLPLMSEKAKQGSLLHLLHMLIVKSSA